MKITPFELERWQSVHEHHVEINLSESGVEPLRVSELLGARDVEGMLSQPLAYTQTNGTAELRSAIASLQADASSDDVLVTSGGAEANFLSCWHLVERGDDVVMMHPSYLQTEHVATAFGARVIPWRLREHTSGGAPRWAPDLHSVIAWRGWPLRQPAEPACSRAPGAASPTTTPSCLTGSPEWETR